MNITNQLTGQTRMFMAAYLRKLTTTFPLLWEGYNVTVAEILARQDLNLIVDLYGKVGSLAGTAAHHDYRDDADRWNFMETLASAALRESLGVLAGTEPKSMTRRDLEVETAAFHRAYLHQSNDKLDDLWAQFDVTAVHVFFEHERDLVSAIKLASEELMVYAKRSRENQETKDNHNQVQDPKYAKKTKAGREVNRWQLMADLAQAALKLPQFG